MAIFRVIRKKNGTLELVGKRKDGSDHRSTHANQKTVEAELDNLTEEYTRLREMSDTRSEGAHNPGSIIGESVITYFEIEE